MGMKQDKSQRQEYVFPDEEDDIQVEEKKIETEAEDKLDIDIVDDTPAKDRGRKPMKEAPAEVTDEELAEYSDGVRKRIKHFSKGYHDERRAREAATREKEEAIRLAQSILEENKQLKSKLTQGERLFLEQAQKTTESEIEKASRAYKDAYEAGDADKLVEAQRQLSSAQVTLDRIKSYVPPVQNTENEVYNQGTAQKPNVPKPDPKSLKWQEENEWFGNDDEMTSFALGVHEKLVKSGVDPRTDEYYEKVNSRMREVFPSYFKDDEDDDPPVERRASSPVAPATRSTAPKRVKLTQTQVALAKRLGVPLEQYAKQVAALEKQNG